MLQLLGTGLALLSLLFLEKNKSNIMNFSFLKIKKNHLPSFKTLRPPIFDIDKFWFGSLGIGLAIFLLAGFIGFNFLYSEYFESYKESRSSENYDNLINVSKLKSAIEKRSNFVNEQISLPKDPSL
jgi:hypothetical protein